MCKTKTITDAEVTRRIKLSKEIGEEKITLLLPPSPHRAEAVRAIRQLLENDEPQALGLHGATKPISQAALSYLDEQEVVAHLHVHTDTNHHVLLWFLDAPRIRARLKQQKTV